MLAGYYADVSTDCQSFHVCHPVVYQDGFEEIFKWTFECPNQTIFDQVHIISADSYQPRAVFPSHCSGEEKCSPIFDHVLPK